MSAPRYCPYCGEPLDADCVDDLNEGSGEECYSVVCICGWMGEITSDYEHGEG